MVTIVGLILTSAYIVWKENAYIIQPNLYIIYIYYIILGLAFNTFSHFLYIYNKRVWNFLLSYLFNCILISTVDYCFNLKTENSPTWSLFLTHNKHVLFFSLSFLIHPKLFIPSYFCFLVILGLWERWKKHCFLCD